MQKKTADQQEISHLIYCPDILHFLPKDPFSDKTFRTIFKKLLSVEVRIESSSPENQIASNEKLMFHISKREETIGKTILLIQLESKSDVFFEYRCEIDSESFLILKEINGLSGDFAQFVSGTADLFVKIFKKPLDFLLIFYIDPKGSGRLEITQNFDYKVGSCLVRVIQSLLRF